MVKHIRQQLILFLDPKDAEQIEKISFPTKLKFKKISLIQQEDGGQWKILQEFEFSTH